MKIATYSDLSFNLPDGDVVFSRKLGNFVTEIPKALTHVKLQPTGTLVVIGACFGATVVAGLKLAGMSRVIAFEPDPRNRDYLERNLVLNDVVEKVTVVPHAVAAKSGMARMWWADETNIGGSGILPNAPNKVRTVGLDEYLSDIKVTDVGLVWCDAQGSEPEILKGAANLLKGDVPWGIELAPGLITSGATSFYRPLSSFDSVVDLRTMLDYPAMPGLPTLYAHYRDTKSPNNPNHSWHTQLFVYRQTQHS
jgi:FkbM family methyltransferase